MEKLVFAVNGERFELELSEVDPSTNLLEFLRTQTPYKGAKLGCGEGGCGACVVLLSTYDPITEQVTDFSVSSCLTLLCSINFCSVTTTEGLGNIRNGFHPIHERLSGFHASQCGFCTPGMCMSIFSALVNADKNDRPEPLDGFSKLTVSEAERAIAGNLCRCTGYRPIVDTCKSFAADVDLEDLGLNAFWKKGNKDANVGRLPYYNRDGICTFPEFLRSEIKSSLTNLDVSEHTSFGGGCWYRPKSIEKLYKILDLKTFSEGRVKMVVGNTGSGVYKELDLYDKYIDLKGIPELTIIRSDHKGIEIGAAVTISRTIEVLRKKDDYMFISDERSVFNKIADHLDKVASQFVRNTASLGGNLMMAQRNQFPSDIATILLAAGSIVCIQTSSEILSLKLEEFLERPPCDYKTLLVSVYIPSWSTSSFSGNIATMGSRATEKADVLFKTYRAAPRPLGGAVAYLNAAFLAHISLDKASGYHVLDNLHLAFGAYGCEHAIRARQVETFLVGKPITASVLLEAIRLLRKTVVAKEGTPHAAYRSSLAVAFLFSFLHPIAKDLAEPRNALQTEVSNPAVSAKYSNGSHKKLEPAKLDLYGDHHILLSSNQVVELSNNYYPVGEPTKKVGAEIQASGEAVYVDDIPSPKDCLYGTFVYSTRPLAHIKGIKFDSSLVSRKIIAIVSVDDIPEGGSNVGASSIFGPEPLFAESLTEYAGQPLSIVVAETQRFASMAAKNAVVTYSTENLEPPILSVEEAVRRCSFFEVPSVLYPKQIGDFSKGMTEADHTILSAEVKLDSQYYFYMETQTALAVPDEDNCMVVYSSSQCPEITHGVIAKCLGIPLHNVRVITRRVGGGFGGKAIRSLPVATACALAAYKLRRPVRMYLDRKTDMIMTGGRHPMKVSYSVGFKTDGKITALHIDLLINAGITKDVSPVIPHNLIGALKKYNWGALSFNVKVCKTNISTKSAMRGPGEVQGSYIAEAIIEHVASALSTDANSVRQKNLHTFESLLLFYEGSEGESYEYTLPSIFGKLASSTSYQSRVEMIHCFNSDNRWKKRGISCVPIIHNVMLFCKPGKVSVLNDGSVVVEVGGIELGQGLWTKVKQMAAFSLGQLWADGSQDLLEMVRVIQADTLSLIQGGWTTGSTTSESSCEAVRLACNVLVERLQYLKDRLQEQNDTVSWNTLVSQAYLQSINLSASAYWVPDHKSKSYLNYGAAISEVEVDLLTGATTILRSDLSYDCGQSLNPAVDLGQVEGAFVQGIGFFMCEEYVTNSDGLVISDGTWTYKIPTVDTIPKQFNVELVNSGHHKKCILSSKASGEPPLLLAASVHCATREAIRSARTELFSRIGSKESPLAFQLEVPATMPVVKELCGLDNVEKYLETLPSANLSASP
ncbi:indole-3-acetaldehyde oxidase-like [Typha angustifolia]|uniref:indole-3-acetaldehyde oxidase-like n=1 Tax=Typha angustifolia TaxID=59011 RepID=UPI003C2AEC19